MSSEHDLEMFMGVSTHLHFQTNFYNAVLCLRDTKYVSHIRSLTAVTPKNFNFKDTDTVSNFVR